MLPETSGEQCDFTDLEASLCKLTCQIVLDNPSVFTECVCARHGFPFIPSWGLAVTACPGAMEGSPMDIVTGWPRSVLPDPGAA